MMKRENVLLDRIHVMIDSWDKQMDHVKIVQAILELRIVIQYVIQIIVKTTK